jgi:hypothetical protein
VALVNNLFKKQEVLERTNSLTFHVQLFYLMYLNFFNVTNLLNLP